MGHPNLRDDHDQHVNPRDLLSTGAGDPAVLHRRRYPGDDESAGPRWFCGIGTRTSLGFSSTDAARPYLRRHCPRVLDLASSRAVAAFATRTYYHIGQKLTCSQCTAAARF